MPRSFSRQKTKPTRVAIIALFCLCWHLLLPTMINLGWTPAVYGMSEHCQMLAGQTMDMPQVEMKHHHQVEMLAQKQEQSDSTEKIAEKVMKNCPLCSHGLSGGLLVLFSGGLPIIHSGFAQAAKYLYCIKISDSVLLAC